MKTINQSSDFNEATKNPGVVLVDCHAVWCAPCKALKPILEKFEQEHQDIKVLALDIDEHPGLAQSLEIRGVPTLIWIKNGEIVHKEVGLRKASQLEDSLEKLK